MSMKSDNKKLSPEAQLRAFVGKYDPKNQKLFRSVRAAMRKRIPTANELAYDYSHALVISYAPAEHGIDAVVAISVRTDGVFLHFNQGPKLPDPQQLLRGAGKLTRFIQLRAASELANLDGVDCSGHQSRERSAAIGGEGLLDH